MWGKSDILNNEHKLGYKKINMYNKLVKGQKIALIK